MTRRHRFQPFPPRAAWCRWLGGGLCALALLAAANGAYAQRSGRAQTEAGKLADRGYDLMQRGEHAAAATLFLRADERFHSPVFLVFAAQAEEKQRHLLAARRLLKRVATERLSPNATAAFRNARSKAQKQLPALDKRIPRVVVSARGYRGRVTVELDGRSLDDRLGTAVRVDPGRHQLIAATKTGTERQRFTVAEGERKSIALVFVEKDDVAAPMVPEPADPDEGSGDGTRVAGIVALSVGAGAAIVWGATGLSFIAATDDLKQACEGYRDDPNLCPPAQADARASVVTMGNVSTAFAVVAGVGLLSGVVLVAIPVSDDSDEPLTADASLGVGPSGIWLTGRF